MAHNHEKVVAGHCYYAEINFASFRFIWSSEIKKKSPKIKIDEEPEFVYFFVLFDRSEMSQQIYFLKSRVNVIKIGIKK